MSAALPLAGLDPHHFSISVPDLDQSIAFWSDLFGFTVERRFALESLGAQAAFMTGPGLRIELWCLAGSAPVPPERRTPNSDLLTQGTKHVAFTVPDLQAAIETLHASGVPIVAVQRDRADKMRAEADPRLAPGDARKPAFASFIADPGGALIELIQAA